MPSYARTCVNALPPQRRPPAGRSIAGVLRVGGFVASDPAFTGQPAVVNGASEVLGEIFGDAGSTPVPPSASRAAAGHPVEVEVTFILA